MFYIADFRYKYLFHIVQPIYRTFFNVYGEINWFTRISTYRIIPDV